MTTTTNSPAIPPGARLFGRHPSMWLSTLSAVLMLGPALSLPGLSAVQVAAINLAVATVTGAVWAWQVRPIAPAVYTQVVTALAGLGAAYGLDVPSETVGVVQAIVVQVLGLITWGLVSPAGAPTAVAPPAPAPAITVDAPPVDSGQQLAPGAHRAATSSTRPTMPPPDGGRPPARPAAWPTSPPRPSY